MISYPSIYSMVIGYNEFVNKGGGEKGFAVHADPKKLKLGGDVVIKKDGKVELEDDQTKRNYLHLKPGTLGQIMVRDYSPGNPFYLSP